MNWVVDYLNGVPLAGLMLVVACGYALGLAHWRGVSLGPAGGTLFVALAFGHIGLSFEQLYAGNERALTAGMLGFALFIYSVGFEAGPGFFGSLRSGRGGGCRWRGMSSYFLSSRSTN